MKLIKRAMIFTILVVAIMCIPKAVLATTGVVDADTLNLRENPSTDSSILKLLNRDEKVEILEQDGDWYKIEANGTTGYAHSDYIKETQENDTENENSQVNENTQENNEIVNNETENNEEENNPIENNTTINNLQEEIKIEKQINIYILPLINSTKISETEVGETVTVIASTDKWVFISAKEVNGWIVKEQIIQNIAENGTEGNPENTTGNTNNEEDGENDNETTSNETTPQENEPQTQEIEITPKTMYVNASSIYVRKGPGTDYEYIDSLILNSSVIVTHEVGDWYKVKVSGIEGYIAKRLLSDTTKDSTSRGEVNREETEQKTQNTEEAQEVATTSIGNQIVEYAKQYLGCKYVYGGSGPSTFDCSGFTMYVYAKFGVNLSHSARAQAKNGTYVAKEDLQPGDIVFFKDYETMDGIGHCGIYIGNGDFIHASSGTGYCVKISTLLSGSYNTRYETARRLI